MKPDLRCCDAFALLASLPDGSVDVVLTDPPFDARTHAHGVSGFRADMSLPIDFPPLTPEDLARLVAECLRVSQRWVLAFCAAEMLSAYRDASGDAWIRAGLWVKPDPAPQFTGDRPGSWGEALAILHRPGRKRWNGGGRPARWTFGVCREDRVHPTQKPLDLMLALLADFTDPGELILDPFSGSGSTAVACLRAGRRFLGCENDPAMHAIALERLAAEQNCSTLRAARAGQIPLFAKEPR